MDGEWFSIRTVNVIDQIQQLVKCIRMTEPLNKQEKKSTLILIKLSQQDTFKEKLHKLSQKSGKLPRSQQMYQLDLIFKDDIMRVGGRLRRASPLLNLRHPTCSVQEMSSHTSSLFTITLKHMEAEDKHWMTESQWGFFPSVAQHIRQRVPCRRANGPPQEQQMVDISSNNVNSSPAFMYCCMDLVHFILCKVKGMV